MHRIAIAVILLTPLLAHAAPPLELKKGDHICIIGSALAERMQHDGWLETMLHARFPDHELVIRNLGFSGDEITTRLRSAGFGSPDEWLHRCQADVIFAFFGDNESWAGEAGLPKFNEDLDKWIKHTLAKTYNGKSPPRVALFSPIKQKTPSADNLPDVTQRHANIALYSSALATHAQNAQVFYVDLDKLISDHHGKRLDSVALTRNGQLLHEFGNYAIATAFADGMFGTGNQYEKHPDPRDKFYVGLRQAVLDKNFYWFQRYRTVDGYSIFGDRSFLKFTNGQTNREVMQREMEILDVMTANRDKKIWAVAQGKDFTVDDSNTPAFIPVITNAPGKGPNGTHTFLGGKEAITKMRTDPNVMVNLFASEEKFPELANPVQMTWDAKGRLWVAVWPTYPHWMPKEPMNDKILIFEDVDGNGEADKMTIFADRLHCPTGFELWNGGVIVAQAPDLMFLKDTNGDDQADIRERILHGLDSADTHHTANSFTFDPGGALYFQEGTFHHTQVETPWGPPVRCINGGVFRYEPRTHKFEVYVAHNFANPHGHVFDRWGQDIVVDGTGSQPYHAALFSGHLNFPHRHRTPPQVYQQRTRPCPGIEILSSRAFPFEWQGQLLVANVIGDQGILRYKLDDEGASFSGKEMTPLLLSSDPNFRPSDIKVGPDGAIYFLDWHNPIIGHMQHNLRDPSRDRTHGRIYRVTHVHRPVIKSPPIAGESIEKLLDCLMVYEDRTRYRARLELSTRKTAEVVAALETWWQGSNIKDSEFEHHRLEALWQYQAHNVVNMPLLKQVLVSPSFRARAAAVRVLCYWRDRVPDALELLSKAAEDVHPRVRLEAIRAASFFTQPEAVEIALLGGHQQSDRYLSFLRSETVRSLEPYWKPAISSGKPVGFKTTLGKQFEAHHIPTERLLKLDRSYIVCMEMLMRAGLSDAQRSEALKKLAEANTASDLGLIIRAIRLIDQNFETRDDATVFDLVRLMKGQKWPTDDTEVGMFQSLPGARKSMVRQASYLALITLDDSIDRAWASTNQMSSRLKDFLTAVPRIPAPHRAKLYNRIQAIVNGSDTPKELRHTAMAALASIRGQETQTFKTLSRFLEPAEHRDAAARALQSIPRTSWPADFAPILMDQLMAIVKAIPANKRNEPGNRAVFEFADALTNVLLPEQAANYRKELQALGIRVVRIGTLPERMSYDTEFIAVQAGKPVEILFENTDMMPHNLVIGQPGSLEELGLLAEASATDADAPRRNYVPQSKKVLASSRLVQPRESQRLLFNAPTVPGVYPIVCTYPGHWRVMNAALYVVPELELYLSNPEKYLSDNSLLTLDALLKDRRPRTEWKVADLAEAVAGMKQGRSFTNGKQLFQSASCSACHKLDGVGNNYGPDLMQMDPKWTGVDVLKEILSPSERINEKHQSYVIATTNGKFVTGLIIQENSEGVTLIENPLSKADPVILKSAQIESREKSPTSLMPKGLVDKLTKDEILDLIAYVMSKGNKEHPLFHHGTGHRHGK